MLARVLVVLAGILHLPIIYLIYYLWQPISSWYLSKVPALGVDLFLSSTYASYHLKNFSLPFNSFQDFWFGGYPLFRAFPQMAFYLMVPFVAGYGPVVGVMQFTVFALLALVVSCYFLYFKLSKNHGLALLLALLILLSPNIYGAATWAGSIPYFASQAIFPLGLLAGVFYLEKQNLRRLAVMMLLTGAGFWIHPLSVVTFLIPSALLIIVFGGIASSLKLKQIIVNFALFNLGWLLAGYAITYQYVYLFITRFGLPVGLGRNTTGTGGAVESTAQAQAVADFFKSLVPLLWQRTNDLIFVILVLGVVLFVVTLIFYRKKTALFVIPIALVAIWAVIHPVLNLGGIFNIFRHDPYRAFWQFPIALGALGAFLWGYFFTAIDSITSRKIYFKLVYLIVSLGISTILAIYSYFTFTRQLDSAIRVMETNTEYSSAFPEALGIQTSKSEIEDLKKQLVPSFIDPSDRNRRLYVADATVNIWWNAFFDMPLARGYIDPPVGTQSRGGFFWLDIAIANDSLVRDFKVPEEIAFKNALFLIDWYGIGFYEGGRLSSKGPSVAPSTYLLNSNVFDKDEMVTAYGAILKWLTASGKPEVVRDIPQNLHYFRVADEFTSPVLYPTNAPAIAIFTIDPSYEDYLRILAYDNLNSRILIPVKAGDFIDTMDLKQLENFDALILHGYRYNNKKIFETLKKYVENGGNLFIDTGAESKDSESGNLAEIFPFDSTKREGMGKDWDLTAGEGQILEGIDFGKFGPLVFDDNEWKISTVADGGKIKSDAAILLSHRGKPVLVERNIGKGKVIWSGLNLAYHYNQYKSDDEAKLFLNILKQFVDLGDHGVVPAKTEWESSESVIIETDQQPRGILFKEQLYDGWRALGQSKSLPIYKAGPTFPGFMYVPLDVKVSGPVKLKFTYSGSKLFWLVSFINLISILVLLDLIVLKGRVARLAISFGRSKLSKKLSLWWEKEDE